MPIVLLAAVAVGALLLSAWRRGPDLPERIVVAAATWLPAHQRTWGRALVAELAAVQGRGQRWLFAAGALRIALFPPAARPRSVQATAAVGVLATAAATATTMRILPTLSVFTAVLGLLSTGYAAMVACRWQRFSADRVQLVAGALAVAGVLAALGAVISVAATHPAATRDQTHLFSILFAVILCGYLIAALTTVAISSTTRTALWGATIGASATVVAAIALRPAGAISSLIPPVTAAATLATAVVTSAVTRSRTAGARAGLLTAMLSAPMHFAVAIIALQQHPAVLTDAYDIAAYPRSGFPDVASYLLSDALGGNIINMAVTPLIMYALAALGASVAARSSGGLPAVR